MNIWSAPEQLVASINSRKPIHLKGCAPAVSFSYADLVDWLNFSDPDSQEAFFVKDGQRLDLPRNYFNSKLNGGNKVLSKINKNELLHRLAHDASLVVKNFDGLHAKAFNLSLAIGSALQAVPHANLYVTPAKQQAFDAHSDPYDLVIVQLEGKKTWTVEGLGELEMNVGDVLFIPAGKTHQARAASLSIHLSVGLYPMKYKDILSEIAGSEKSLPLKKSHVLDLEQTTSGLQQILQKLSKSSESDLHALISKSIIRRMKDEWVAERVELGTHETERWILDQKGFSFIAEAPKKLIVTSKKKQIIIETNTERISELLTRETTLHDWRGEEEVFDALRVNGILRLSR